MESRVLQAGQAPVDDLTVRLLTQISSPTVPFAVAQAPLAQTEGTRDLSVLLSPFVAQQRFPGEERKAKKSF